MTGLFALLSLTASARDWISIWRGFDSMTMGVDGLEISDDRREIVIVLTFVNNADTSLRIHALESGVRLTGRSISGSSEAYRDLVLGPGDSTTINMSTRVTSFDVQAVDDAIAASEGTWNVSGRVRVSVEDLSDSLWLPFRSDIAVGL